MTSDPRGRPLLIDLGLLAVVLLIYAQALSFDFVKVDDTVYVTQNPHVLGGLSSANVAWAFRSFENSNWHPLTWISLMADATIGGGKPWAFHATNIAIHAVNAMLLFHLLLAATRSSMKSAFVAALFAVHPLHVESVAWITERKDVLSTLFWFLAIAAHIAYARGPSIRRYAAIVAAFVLGAMSKPMVVTLPLTLLLLDFWPLERWGGRKAGATGRFTPVVEKLPLLVVSVASSVVTLVAQKAVSADLSRVPVENRLVEAFVAYATYAAKTVWPVNLSIHFVFAHPIPAWKTGTSALALAGASWLAVALRRRYPYLLVGWLWYVVTLVPVIGLVKVGEQSIADRYTYVPLVGLFVVVAWGVPDLFAASTPKAASIRKALAALAGLVLLALAARAYVQVKVWRDAFWLFQHAVTVNGESTLARMGLGQELALQGRDAEAIEQFRLVLATRPSAQFARRHLAECLERTGQLEESSAEYSELLRFDPEDAEAGLGLGVVLLERNDPAEAASVLYRAQLQQPGDARIRATLGLALTRLERKADAEAAFEDALRIDPASVLAHKGIAVVLGNTGRTEEAIAHLRRALELAPHEQDARDNLAKLLLRQGGNGASAPHRDAPGTGN